MDNPPGGERGGGEDQGEFVKGAGEEPLFDLVIPPGVPRSIIRDVLARYKVELVHRTIRLSFANMEGDERDVLAFRGEHDDIVAAEAYIKEKLQEFIGE